MHRIPARLLFVACALSAILQATNAAAFDFGPEILVSVHDQQLAIVERGAVVARYRISTSKFGIGDSLGSYKTPVGSMFVCNKIGDNLPSGAVIKGRSFTGEILKPNAPGRDPIVSRVIWLRGTETQNRHAYDRCIYIHGTAEEKQVGKPVSFGCIRMRSKDVISLYDQVRIGTRVVICDQSLKQVLTQEEKEIGIARAN